MVAASPLAMNTATNVHIYSKCHWKMDFSVNRVMNIINKSMQYMFNKLKKFQQII